MNRQVARSIIGKLAPILIAQFTESVSYTHLTLPTNREV